MNTFNENDFKRLSEFVYNNLGIDIDERKKETVTTKISRLMKRNNIESYKEYIDKLLVSSDSDFLQEFYNEITTNTTEFFREKAHFDFIAKNINDIINEIPRIKRNCEIRCWSAPCSSGEESVTLAMVLKECLPSNYNIKILATDISVKVLEKAAKGIYGANECKGIPSQYLSRYMIPQSDGSFKVADSIHDCITYRAFNLMDSFNFKNGFDIIFCRNVMIYFDTQVQQSLIDKFHAQLQPNGLFFIGHSESMINKKNPFKYVSNAVYKKIL